MNASAGPFAIGVDIGGTFTDVVCLDAGGPYAAVEDPDDAAQSERRRDRGGRLDAAAVARRRLTRSPVSCTARRSRPTPCSNAKGARIGLITTAGFKDVLEIGRQMRHAMYDLVLKPETPVFLAPGAFRKEVPERVGPAGEVLVPLDEAAVARAVGELAAEGVEAIAVCYLFSFVNPAHERRTREIISRAASRADGLAVLRGRSGVSRIRADLRHRLRRLREAGGRPLSGSHGAAISPGAGVGAPLQVMQSRGGVCSSSVARRRPVRLFLSGPAAGVVGALEAGASVGLDDLITVDIGGTSCDIALISGGMPLIRAESTIAGYSRARADGRCHDDRRGRRQHRLARCRRRVAGRAAIGRLGAGPGLLRSRRRRGDGDRCLGRARLYRPGLFRRRLAEARAATGRARPSRGRSHDRSACRSSRRRSASTAS